MERDVGRWLAPAGASAAVLAVFLVPGLVAATTDGGTGGGGGGTNRDRHIGGVTRPQELITPNLPAEPIETEGTSAPAVEITGYRTHGRTLTLFYNVDQSTDCSSRIEPPLVLEGPDAVIVFVRRRMSRAPGEVCAHLMLANSVDISLHRPLENRVLQDGGFDEALVPAAPLHAGAALPTPPISRAGR
ncbi:MAG: hypothetical protein ACJ72A_14535 [Nocardioidaceae bacterium]